MSDRICFNCFREKTSDGPCPYCGYDPKMDRELYPEALPHGSLLADQYITGRVLGQGGFGITYIALDKKLQIKVAVKEYLPDMMAGRSVGSSQVVAYTGERGGQYQYGLEQFLEEARVLAKFNGNPNIVGVRSFFEQNGTAYFVMDYITGTSFKTYLSNHGGRVSWEEAVKILTPVMDALSAVHKEGIIHRDVTPDNIYITLDGQVKLLDFGAARYSLGDRSRSLDVVLKPGYAPKEQYTRKGRQGAYTDVYSLAACFYAAITGVLPPESLDRMEEDDLVPPSARGIAIPQDLEDVILRGLEVRAEDRYQTMGAFHKDLIGDMPEPKPEPEPEPSDKTFFARIKALPKAAKVTITMIACLAILCPIVFSVVPFVFPINEDGVQTAAPASQPPAQRFTQQPAQQSTPEPQEETYVTNRSFNAYNCTYTGEVSNGIPNGKGTANYFNGNIYVGDFKNGWPDGTGTMTYDNGDQYVGSWYEGGRSGWGTMTYAGKEGYRSGRVTMIDNGGGKYNGEWKNDERNGQGIMTYANGDEYEGKWKDDKKNGQGIYKWADDCEFNGEWKNDERNGIGTIVYASRQKYKGEWKNDEKNGEGAWYYEDGSVYRQGKWQNNSFVSGHEYKKGERFDSG